MNPQRGDGDHVLRGFEDAVEARVAQKGACRCGHARRNALCQQRLLDPAQGQRSNTCCCAVWRNRRFPEKLSLIISRFEIREVKPYAFKPNECFSGPKSQSDDSGWL